jgi:hypothetical protein
VFLHLSVLILRIYFFAVLKTPPLLRSIPFRAMNYPTGRAAVIGNCVTWHCVCGNPVALQGRSGPASGPTPESVVVCERCARVYFVIPQDKSHGPPIEVVELFGLPAPNNLPSATDSAVPDITAQSSDPGPESTLRPLQ